ncbi:MAG: hypothetical protein OSJ27_03175 [Candidatus Gastranaerophilales bacterium]|nr:hypothetical protein [Candidatus Gastranaerophilales bacterium]
MNYEEIFTALMAILMWLPMLAFAYCLYLASSHPEQKVKTNSEK